MPDVVDIIQSVQVPLLIKDKQISKGKPMLDNRNRPIHYTGGFAVVFPFLVNGEKWAFRCWSADIGNVEKRLHTLSAELSKLQLPYFCNFAYEPLGIVINGVAYPTTRMQWVDGKNIKDYLCENKDDSDKIKKLSEDFLQMCRTLHKNEIAHGDLQHGNILVDNTGKLFLIDYDSVYLPALKGEDDIISGLPDYQHPDRKNNKTASEKLDYFSELVIYLSICSIAANPSLIEKYQIENADRLLFSKEDLENIKQSEIYRDIISLGEKFKDLLQVLESYLEKKDINDLLPFEEVLIGNKVKFIPSAKKVIRNKETITLEWYVPINAEITLIQSNSNFSQKCPPSGRYETILGNDAEFRLIIETPNGVHVEKSVKIRVFDECSIEFSSDKKYVFPTLPVVLTWNTTNAIKVWLNNEEVEQNGSKIVEPTSDTVYVLKAEDEFGVKEKRITVQVIPIKQMKVLLASPPNFTLKQTFTINKPKYVVGTKFPKIEIDWVKVRTPYVPSLKDLGINVELSPPIPKSNLMSSIKKVFNHIIRK